MSSTREAYHHGDLRNALVASAIRLIEDTGPGAFSLREAAREVGVSANAAYRHFEDKSALMGAAAEQGFGQLSQCMIRAMDRASKEKHGQCVSIARFKSVGRAYIEFALDHPELFRLMFSQSGAECLSPRKTRGISEGEAETPWGLLGQALDSLVHDGVMTKERREGAELKAWTVVHGFASLALDGHAVTSAGRGRKAVIESVLDFAVMGLCGVPTKSFPLKN
jgi:AcrR family transcriptional regulator